MKHLSKNLDMKVSSFNLPTFPIWEEIMGMIFEKFFYNVIICAIGI